MTLFFLYHPASYAWLPAPDGGIKKRLDKEERAFQLKLKKLRQRQLEEEAIIVLLIKNLLR